MTAETLKEQVRRELPEWLRTDPQFRDYVLELTRDQYADRRQTEGRFEAMLAELARDREERSRKWAEQDRKWEEENRKWDEQNRAWRQHADEVWAEFRRLHEENPERDKRFDRSIGALGARWGLCSPNAPFAMHWPAAMRSRSRSRPDSISSQKH
jgi:hypothetical protein